MVSCNSIVTRAERSERWLRAQTKRRRLLYTLFICTLLLIGCTPASPSPVPAQPSETPSLPTATSLPETATALPADAARIRNAEYQLGATDSLGLVQLTDGKYQQGTAGEPDYVSVNLTDFVASGDLNGDGMDEIAALIGENYGGSGTFVFLAVYSVVDGKLTFQTSTLVDDRPALNALSIENGEVLVDAATRDADDPFCCPTLRTNRHYRLLIENQLQMTDYTTFTPDGRPRTITIESPTNGTAVDSSVRLKGTVAIAPFENNLAYRIFSTGDVELAAGSISVSAAEMGGPGTFDSIISLGNILSGAVVRIEIQDLSAADGSLLAMDSVELVVK